MWAACGVGGRRGVRESGGFGGVGWVGWAGLAGWDRLAGPAGLAGLAGMAGVASSLGFLVLVHFVSLVRISCPQECFGASVVCVAVLFFLLIALVSDVRPHPNTHLMAETIRVWTETVFSTMQCCRQLGCNCVLNHAMLL